LATLILCIEIFLFRIIDVSLGTIRTIIVVRGKSLLAAVVGFFEVLIWFLIAREALNNASGIWVAIAYTGGFATGTFCGSLITKRIIKDTIEIQVVTSGAEPEIVSKIRQAGYAVTVLDVKASEYGGSKYLLIMEVNSRLLTEVKKLIKDLDPHAFIVLHDTKKVYDGFMKRK
jgi:uncharacterized protein YebE (UPF0316 family)